MKRSSDLGAVALLQQKALADQLRHYQDLERTKQEHRFNEAAARHKRVQAVQENALHLLQTYAPLLTQLWDRFTAPAAPTCAGRRRTPTGAPPSE